MPVLFHDIKRPGLLEFAADAVSLEELLSNADVISLHVPLTPRTREMIDAGALARCKPSAHLINTARGAVVERMALATALQEGRLAGAAIDVFDPEPPAPDHPLLSAPGVLLTPHLGARTISALRNMNAVVEDVTRVLRGQTPLFPAPDEEDRG